MVASGCAFAATNVATKLLGDDVNVEHWGNAVVWGALAAVMGVLATIVNMTAFQRCAATVVVPVSTAVQTFLPIVLEPLFLREQWGSAAYDGGPLIAGLALALVGCILITTSPAVGRLVAAS